MTHEAIKQTIIQQKNKHEAAVTYVFLCNQTIQTSTCSFEGLEADVYLTLKRSKIKKTTLQLHFRLGVSQPI